MKAKAVVVAAAVVSAAVVFGQELVPAGKPRVPAKEKPAKELTPEEVEQNRAKAAAFRKAIADRGGWVSVPMAGPALRLVDATAKGWALEGLEAVKANLDRYGLCPAEAVRRGVPVNALAEGLEAAKGTCGVVMLVDGAEDAPLMAVYPEERLALIDMTALSKGVKGSGMRQDRVEKLTWRAIGRIVGCGAPEGYTCVMKPLGSMAELDAMPNKFIHPATFFKARPYFDMCGVTPARKGTYESACQQGWAPAPTNEVQKAIWDKVHAIPTEPLKIKYQKPDQATESGK